MDPREQRTRSAVVAAVKSLLKEGGPEAVTHSSVARRAGVGRTTLYRHWPDHSALLDEATAGLEELWNSTRTGDIRRDLIAAMAHMAKHLSVPTTRSMMLNLMERAQHDETTMHTQAAFERKHPVRLAIQQAIDTGKIDGGLDPTNAAAQLVGPIFYSSVGAQHGISNDEIIRLVDEFLAHHAVEG